MLNVSGHLMSTAEVEAVLTEHPRVSEAAVVSRPHPVKGECKFDETIIGFFSITFSKNNGQFKNWEKIVEIFFEIYKLTVIVHVKIFNPLIYLPGLYCFITPNQNETFDKKMTDELKVLVRERIGKLFKHNHLKFF